MPSDLSAAKAAANLLSFNYLDYSDFLAKIDAIVNNKRGIPRFYIWGYLKVVVAIYPGVYAMPPGYALFRPFGPNEEKNP